MAAIRTAIRHIRMNWSDYPEFVKVLEIHLKSQQLPAYSGEEMQCLVDSILTVRKEWSDRQVGPFIGDNFDVIRLYTSNPGYRQIFSMLNSALRMDTLTHEDGQLQATVFLIELLNIDLYNYTNTRQSPNFQGVVYRGVSLHKDQIQEFRDLAAKPAQDRHWSVPLSMMSASTSTEVALRFARSDAKNCTTHQPFLWRIHVADLHPKLLGLYQDRFPTSVVTSLCAVPIHELSQFEEEEVLLRGPFFQLICVGDEIIDGQEPAIPVMDLVMLNTNRDHPSSFELESEDEARVFFACIVGMGRAAVCKEIAKKYNLLNDMKEYEEMYKKQQERLIKLGRQVSTRKKPQNNDTKKYPDSSQPVGMGRRNSRQS